MPQGSVLGPILFVVYISDMPEAARYCKTELFADDSKLIGRVNSLRDYICMQNDLDRIVEWTEMWKMRLNA